MWHDQEKCYHFHALPERSSSAASRVAWIAQRKSLRCLYSIAGVIINRRSLTRKSASYFSRHLDIPVATKYRLSVCCSVVSLDIYSSVDQAWILMKRMTCGMEICKPLHHGERGITEKYVRQSLLHNFHSIHTFYSFVFICKESHSLQLQVERVLSICRRLDPGSLFLRNKSYWNLDGSR